MMKRSLALVTLAVVTTVYIKKAEESMIKARIPVPQEPAQTPNPRSPNLFSFNEAVLSGTHDIIVIEDELGRLRASAFHVRFGKLKLLRSKEASVELQVNGAVVPVVMKLNGAGEAYFIDESGAMLSPRSIASFEELKDVEPASPFSPTEDAGPFLEQMRRNQELRRQQINTSQPSPTRGDPGEDVEAELSDHVQTGEDVNQIELSLCGHLSQDVPRAFAENRVTFEELRRDPWGILSNPNLLIKVADQLYSVECAIPLIVSLLAFKKPLKVPVDSQTPLITYEDHIMSSPNSIYLDSDRLRRLNLNPGANEIVYTVRSRLQGTQVLKGKIYLWKAGSKIVISDVDGTITRSDVLGNLLPIVGKDWSQTGVCPLYNRIVSNGYQILYLTSRPIGDVERTKDYLRSLRQENSGLPDGPLFTSPDRLMPSFVREVILRESQKFKAGVLRELQLLFPVHSQPFYAGFGNRENDAVAYGAVGVPLDRIYIINPAGEIAQLGNPEVLTYSTLATLAEEVFPLIS